MPENQSKNVFASSLEPIHYKIMELISSYPVGKALDLPSGPGRLSLWLHEKGFDVMAGDINPDSFLIEKVPVLKVDLDDHFPIADTSFDYAFCIEGPEHVENLYHTFREFARVLKPGGKLIISYPNYSNLESRIRMIFYGVLEPVEYPTKGYCKNNGHINRQPIAMLKQALLHAGFHIDEIKPESIKKNQLIFLFPLYVIIFIFTFLKGKRGYRKYWLSVSNQFNVIMGGNSLLIISSKSER